MSGEVDSQPAPGEGPGEFYVCRAVVGRLEVVYASRGRDRVVHAMKHCLDSSPGRVAAAFGRIEADSSVAAKDSVMGNDAGWVWASFNVGLHPSDGFDFFALFSAFMGPDGRFLPKGETNDGGPADDSYFVGTPGWLKDFAIEPGRTPPGMCVGEMPASGGGDPHTFVAVDERRAELAEALGAVFHEREGMIFCGA